MLELCNQLWKVSHLRENCAILELAGSPTRGKSSAQLSHTTASLLLKCTLAKCIPNFLLLGNIFYVSLLRNPHLTEATSYKANIRCQHQCAAIKIHLCAHDLHMVVAVLRLTTYKGTHRIQFLKPGVSPV